MDAPIGVPLIAALVLVVLISVSVLIGHSFSIPLLISWGAGFVSMKYITALTMIVAAGAVLATKYSTRVSVAINFGASTAVLLSVFLVSGASNLLGIVESSHVMTVHPGFPSTGALLCFFAIATDGIILSLTGPSRPRYAAVAVLILTLTAMAGYALNVPTLYWYVKGWSTGMALPTAVCFVLLAACMLRKNP